MKKIIIIVFLLFASSLFALDMNIIKKEIDFSGNSYSIDIGSDWGAYIFHLQKERLKLVNNKKGYNDYSYYICIDDFKIDSKTGFLYCFIDNVKTNVILGEKYLETFSYPDDIKNSKYIGFANIGDIPAYKNNDNFFNERLLEGCANDERSLNYVINKTNTSSFFIEHYESHPIVYNGQYLDKYFITWQANVNQNSHCFPWVENVDGTGINEWIEFELKSPQNVTYVLNGFVDGSRPHLYKYNSRIKEAEVVGWTEKNAEVKQNVHFEDFVYFKTIKFSEPVKKFRIIIKETYSGEKWQDTAISAVLFPILEWEK